MEARSESSNERKDAADDDSDLGADDLRVNVDGDDGIIKKMIRVDDSEEFRSSMGYEVKM